MNLRLLQVGLGPLGQRVSADLVARRLGATVAVVDPAPTLTGRKLSEFVPGAPDVSIAARIEDLRDFEGIDAAIVTTSSDLRACADSFRALLDHGISVVSTCEELIFPWLRHRALAQELDLRAKESGAHLLGTGVNPGFLMDALPLFATAVCNVVRSLRVYRIQDATPRRLPFQRKIGAGLDRAGFEQGIADGWLRHVGLGESLHFCAFYLGWEIERWSESIEPVIASAPLESKLGPIAIGHAAGVRQTAEAIVAGEPLLRFEFQAAIAQPDPHDRVVVDGEPPLDLVVRGGVHGDIATSAIVLNSLRSLLAAPPGLHTMATIPMVGFSDAAWRRA